MNMPLGADEHMHSITGGKIGILCVSLSITLGRNQKLANEQAIIFLMLWEPIAFAASMQLLAS